MFHKLVRRHLKELESKRYPITDTSRFNSFSHLHLNINSLSTHPYTTYPPLKNNAIALSYIQVLSRLGYLPEENPFLREDHILFTHGSVESIDLILRTFCEPGKEAILVTPPTFGYYGYRAAIDNIPVVQVPLMGENFNLLNVERILSESAKVVFLCNPSNPVGTLLNPHELKTIVENFKGIVVVDEAYIEWTDADSCVEWVARHNNLIILRTFSKIWGLAGARVGVTIADPSIIEALHFSQTMFTFSINTAELIEEKMKEYEAVISHKAQIKKLRERFHQFLVEKPETQKVYPGAANFLLVQFDDEKKVEQRLYDAKILVSNCSHLVSRSLRISIGTEQEMISVEEALT